VSGVEPLPEGLPEALAEPGAHPGDPGDPGAAAGVEWLQTHISHVFRTAGRVYKVRKAVDLGFVCFATREERNADCLREVALNRRLAPDVYLGVAPVARGAGGFRMGPVGEELAGPGPDGRPPEHAVVMRRLPDGRNALALLERGALGRAHLDRTAERVARFHDEAALAPDALGPEAWRERCVAPVEDNFRLLGEASDEAVPRALLARARDSARAFARERADRFEARRRAGRGVDGHGDLHLQHLWFERDDEEPLVVDCIEFNEALRRIDAAADVAFLAMDLAYRGRAELAEHFLARYARARDDFDLYGVVDYFASYRASVRAKVASIAAGETEIGAAQRERAKASARRHLEAAAAALAPRGPGPLVLVAGSVGTGKSGVAEELAFAAGGAVVASDRVRKREAGLASTARAGSAPDAGLYAPEARERTYAGVLARARPVAASGRPAVLDATWSRRAWRQRAAALARELGAPLVLVWVRCAPEVARERLRRRAEAGGDPSDAGPERVGPSRAELEPPDEIPDAARSVLPTDRGDWRARIPELATRVRAAARGATPR